MNSLKFEKLSCKSVIFARSIYPVMKRFLIFVVALVLLKGVSAQVVNDRSIPEQTDFSGFLQNLDVSQDLRLQQMVEKHINKNISVNGMPGYRVEVFFKSGATARDEATRVKSEILSAFPDVNVYIKFISPDFKVRAGNFRTKNEALKFMKQLEGRYKSFIVPDVIEFPKNETTE